MNVSIVIPLHNPDEKILKKILKSLKEQKFNGKKEIVRVDKNLGLADSLNYGVKKAKYDIVVSLHQDCIPYSKNWLSLLVNPLKDSSVVASVSSVELPAKFWHKFDFLARILTFKEQKILTPLMDEKGCAYRKSALLKAGLFDSARFKTAGEDFDMYIKLRKIGKIKYPNCKVYHFHHTNFKKRIRKEFQYANGFGALVRIHKTEMPSWHKGVLKSIPLLGMIFFLEIPVKELKFRSILLLWLGFYLNLIWALGFWKGFLDKKESV